MTDSMTTCRLRLVGGILVTAFLAALLAAGCSGGETAAPVTTITTTTVDPSTITDPEQRFHAQIEYRRVSYSSDSAYEIALYMCDRFAMVGVSEAAKSEFTAAVDTGGIPELLDVTRHAVDLLCPEHQSAWDDFDSSTFG